MPGDDSITLRDLIGKLQMLRVECNKCDRHGQYYVDQLFVRLGPDAKLTDCLHKLTADCPRKRSSGLADACGAWCPDFVGLFIRSE
jgi:hypothetical protein